MSSSKFWPFGWMEKFQIKSEGTRSSLRKFSSCFYSENSTNFQEESLCSGSMSASCPKAQIIIDSIAILPSFALWSVAIPAAETLKSGVGFHAWTSIAAKLYSM